MIYIRFADVSTFSKYPFSMKFLLHFFRGHKHVFFFLVLNIKIIDDLHYHTYYRFQISNISKFRNADISSFSLTPWQPKYIQKIHKWLNVIGAKFFYYTISGLDFIGGGPTKPPPGYRCSKKPRPGRVKKNILVT